MIKNLSAENHALLQKTKDLVQEERRITVELIECLERISRTMLYAELGYGSLFEFCTQHLGLSEGSAHRRISAMRLTRDVPIAKEKLRSGELSLSNASRIQVATNRTLKQSHSVDRIQKKSEIVALSLNLSQKECELKLFSELPQLKETIEFTEHTRQIDESHAELTLILTQELKIKIERLQNLLSHSNPNKSLVKLLERLVDQELLRIQKTKPSPSQLPKPELTTPPGQTQYKFTHPAAGKPRAISANIKRIAWSRANGQCQYSGCKSSYQLQIEHCRPVAKGGSNHPENLRLYCQTHNILAAKQEFGIRKMKQFIQSLK